MRSGCFFGAFLMLLAFGIMGFFMLPLLFEGNETIMAWQAAVLCEPGQTFATDFYTERDLRGTRRGGQVYCVGADSTRVNVTEKSVIYALVGFTVPFIIGLVFSTRGMQRRSRARVNGILGAHLDNLPASGSVQIDRRTYQLDPKSVDVNALLQQFGLSDAGGVQAQRSGGGSLTEQLKDLQTAYDRQLITKDEYDRLRQQILDNASRSS
jgi:hypothetical protein